MSVPFLALGVVGRPIFHSLSPTIFRALFESSGREGAYVKLSARSADEGLLFFRELALDAMNVTSPFKENFAALVDELDGSAARLGAVNFVSGSGDGTTGRLRGFNTDGAGVLAALTERGVDPQGKMCLVIGAGGAGRAASFALGSAGGSVVVANRGAERGRLAAALGGGSWRSLEALADLAARADLIVSTLSAEVLPDPSGWLPPGKVVLDADYRRGALAAAQSKLGPPPLDGRSWLLGQALPAWAMLSGARADDAVIAAARHAIETAVDGRRRGARAKRGIALVGIMGSGKTTVGRELAALRDLPFVDLDAAVEAAASSRIPEIFAREGESGFRVRESRALARVVAGGPCILATGGGLVVDPENRGRLAASFATVLIHTPPKEAARRVAGGSRPLLAGADPLARLRDLWMARREAYLLSADLVVRSEGEEAATVAARIDDEID